MNYRNKDKRSKFIIALVNVFLSPHPIPSADLAVDFRPAKNV